MIFLALSWQKIRAKGTTLSKDDFTKAWAGRQSPFFKKTYRIHAFAIENPLVFGTL
jgi:hypothetical protein